MGPLGGSGTCGGADTAGRSELCWWATCTPTARCEAAHAVPLGWLGGSGGHGTHPQHQVSGDQAHRGWAGHFCVTWGEGPQGHALPRRPQTLLCTPGKLATDQRPHSRRKERQPGEGRSRFPQRMEGTDFTETGVTGHTQQSQVHEDLTGAHLGMAAGRQLKCRKSRPSRRFRDCRLSSNAPPVRSSFTQMTKGGRASRKCTMGTRGLGLSLESS